MPKYYVQTNGKPLKYIVEAQDAEHAAMECYFYCWRLQALELISDQLMVNETGFQSAVDDVFPTDEIAQQVVRRARDTW